jgi:hypothetical protein
MEGQLILDRFRIVDELGRGGFGTVFRAYDERLEREVAVKALARGPAGRRVLREAQAAARLNHPAIVTLYELGEAGDAVYLVSELVDGGTIRELLAAGDLSDRDVGEAGIEICGALAHAHQRGVVHRDVKPENIAIEGWSVDGPGPWSRTATGRAMLMDFGIASLAGSDGITRSGEVVGTLAYMAPEQAEGDDAGPPADLYSLALVLYEAWTGANPVLRPTPAATARAIGLPIPSLADRRPDLPAELTAAIDACLDPDPVARPVARELADRLALARPALDAARPVPTRHAADGRFADWRTALLRLGTLAILAGGLALLAWSAGRPGLALVAAFLLLPAPLLFDRAREWLLPPLAPFLGLIGMAPLYPALAGLAASPRRCAGLALLGWCWLALGEAVLSETLLFAPIDPPPAGWELSASAAGKSLLLGLLAPGALAGALAWAGSATLLGTVLRARSLVVRVVGALGWGAGLVAVHRALAGADPEPATAGLVAALVVTLAVGVWMRSAGTGWGGRARGRKEVQATAMARGTA